MMKRRRGRDGRRSGSWRGGGTAFLRWWWRCCARRGAAVGGEAGLSAEGRRRLREGLLFSSVSVEVPGSVTVLGLVPEHVLLEVVWQCSYSIVQ